MAVPKIRFPGFTDAWEQRKFAELANIRRGLTYKPNDVTDSGIRVLRSSNINEDSFIENDDDVFVKESAVNISSVKDGDILITSANGSNRLVGKHAIISKAGQAVHGGFMLIASAYGNPYFLNASMSSSWYTNFVNMYVAGGNGAIGNLKKSDLENQVIRVPSEAEQLRIGQFFQSIDQTITLHQRKLEGMKLLKKSLLQKMFPKSGESVPEVRFPGFTDAWEQRKFESQYKKLTEKNDLSFGPDKIISVANMYFKSDTSKSDDEYMKTYNVMRIGDIAFEGNKSKNFAHGRFVENTIGDGIVSHVFDVFRPIADYDLLFWKYLINNENIMGRVMTRCTKASTMMTNLVAKDFLKESVLVPTIKEQHKIGSFLDCLDKTITLHQRKVEALQKLKKSLLQQMFV